MRHRDLHILTVGLHTFSADRRFKVIHTGNSVEWTLRIKYVTPKDAGLYECQVNSDPKLSRKIFLDVKELSQLDDPRIFKETAPTSPFVNIEGPTQRVIESGSILSLTCIVHHPPEEAPAHLVWLHGDAHLDFKSSRRGISIETEKEQTKTVSRLSIFSVTPDDSGHYKCNPSDLSSSVMVIIQSDPRDAAFPLLDTNQSSKIYGTPSPFVIVAMLWWWKQILFCCQVNITG